MSEFLKNLNKLTVVSISVLLVFLVGLIDYWSGYFLSFSIFYLIPVMFATWYANRTAGIFIAIFSGIVWYEADLLAEHQYPSELIPFWNAALRTGFFLIVSHLLNLLNRSLENETRLARLDHLTKVWNSRAFYEKAELERTRSLRYNHPFTMAYVDLDNFKSVNDTFGHDTGDRLLTLVANTIVQNIRRTDILARLGGDEFALLLVETGEDPAVQLMQRIRKNLLHLMKSNKWPVTFSVGMIIYSKPAGSLSQIIREADALMYEVKKSGKNAIRHRVIPSSL
jgi:diguanylate cyclase (GGDEF)-like protein